MRLLINLLAFALSTGALAQPAVKELPLTPAEHTRLNALIKKQFGQPCDVDSAAHYQYKTSSNAVEMYRKMQAAVALSQPQRPVSIKSSLGLIDKTSLWHAEQIGKTTKLTWLVFRNGSVDNYTCSFFRAR